MDNYSTSLLIAGVDEVGRGAWAGPIVAAAVILVQPLDGLKDSKKLTIKQRQRLYEQLRGQAFAFAIAELSAQDIDELGLTEANRRVMRHAIDSLSIKPDLVRTDGFSCQTQINEEVCINGDEIYPEISAASIIAKVYRDQLMRKLHQTDPRFGFDQHVGYGTKLHQQKLAQHGPSIWHRHSFAPIKSFQLK